jgi:hypothetical protein
VNKGIVKGILAIAFFLFLVSHWNQKGQEAIETRSKEAQNGNDPIAEICKNDALVMGCHLNSKK